MKVLQINSEVIIMHLKEDIDNILKSKIVKLRYEGRVLGLRVKSYDFSSSAFLYHDFELGVLSKNKELYEAVKSLQSTMQTHDLIKHGDRLYTESELKNNTDVGELTDAEQASRILAPVVNLYKRGYINGL